MNPGSPETSHQNPNGTITTESLSHLDQWAIAPILKFEPQILAQDKWQEMIENTQADGNERGIVISWDGKKLLESKVFSGTEAGIVSPGLPHGLKTLSPFINELVNIHTHPLPQDLKVPTTIFSDLDINALLKRSLKALVVLDKGGVHMLSRTPYSSYFSDPEQGDKPVRISNEVIGIAENNTGLIAEARLEMAKRLKPLGINYYYSPDLNLSADRLVELAQVR